MSDLKIPLHELDSHGKGYAFPLAAQWIDRHLGDCGVKADENQAEGSAELHAQRNGQEVLLQGHLRADLVAECVRCLGEARIHVETDMATLMTPKEATPGLDLDDLAVDPDEPDRDYYSGDHLELDEILREYLVLELPNDPLCDAACPGIEIPEHLRAPAELGPTDDSGRAIDPRLAPLMKLAKDEQNKE